MVWSETKTNYSDWEEKNKWERKIKKRKKVGRRDVPLNYQKPKRKTSQRGDLQNISPSKIIATLQFSPIKAGINSLPHNEQILFNKKSTKAHNLLMFKNSQKTRKKQSWTSTCIQEAKTGVSLSCLDDLWILIY